MEEDARELSQTLITEEFLLFFSTTLSLMVGGPHSSLKYTAEEVIKLATTALKLSLSVEKSTGIERSRS